MLRLQHAPAGVQTLLNRIGISTSRDTSTRHLGSLQSAAVLKAKDMMEQKERIHVLLFDNLDLYVRSRPGRVTSSNTLVNLTTRTLLQLPSSFDASLVSASALGALDGSRSLNEDEVLGDCDVIRRSAQLFLARELVRSIKAASRKGKRGVDTITMLETYVNQCQDRVRVDELDAEAWDIAPLPLLEENEGCIEGTLAVLEESAVTLGIMERDELSADTNTNDRDDGSNSSCDGFSILRRTDVLPEGALLFVVGDLKSHRNVEAGIKARRHHEHKEERMDYIRSTPAPWHLLLNWVWAIFKMHFSSAKVGFAASLERLRDALRRGKTALREDEPSFNEAWALIRHTFAGWVRQSFVKELSKQRKDISTWTPKDAQSIQMLVDAVREHLFEEAAVREAQFRHDEVGINARLFLRDALLALEWDDACRRGDVGRMLATQRFLAVGFAGAGRHQYSQSCLDDIWTHKVLTEDSWRTLMAVRLLNRYGARNSFIGADLYQEHLNREIQRADIAHGADTAIARLRDTFSATSEVARAMRKAHQDLLGFSGKRWKEDQRYDRDIDRISNLAGQDGLFDSQLNRYSNETVAKLAAKASSFIGPQIPSAEDLLQDLVLPDYGEDALEKGVMYLRSKGYHRWQKLRTAWDRYDAFLGLALEDEETMSDADSTCSHSSNAPGEQRAGDVRTLSEDARSEIARRMRQREWARREEELDAEEAEGPDVISDGQA
ncbi:hypothetical protein CF319_g266 [Tilletia indica]|nr:hypothetical protein CF319_g266 [Tilletia indica]